MPKNAINVCAIVLIEKLSSENRLAMVEKLLIFCVLSEKFAKKLPISDFPSINLASVGAVLAEIYMHNIVLTVLNADKTKPFFQPIIGIMDNIKTTQMSKIIK